MATMAYTGDTAAFTDVNLQPGATYHYTITALDTAGNESVPSRQFTINY